MSTQDSLIESLNTRIKAENFRKQYLKDYLRMSLNTEEGSKLSLLNSMHHRGLDEEEIWEVVFEWIHECGVCDQAADPDYINRLLQKAVV